MAIDLNTVYPTQTDPANANYPFGVPRNVSVSGAGDGTPWEQAIVRDWVGFFQKILSDASLTPSGSADTALASQYLQGLRIILLQRSELASQGGNILEVGNGLPPGYRDGLRIVWDSGVLMTTQPGSKRNFASTIDLILPASLQKNISVTFAVGPGGGLPAALVPLTTGWKRRFIVTKPDGTGGDLIWDTSPVAANFFTDAVAIAAGYSDANMYARYGWTFVDAGLVMPKHYNSLNDPSVYLWDVPFEDFAQATLQNVSREVFVISHVPPNAFARLGVFADINGTWEVLVTTADQVDTGASSAVWTLRGSGGHPVAIQMDIEVDATQQIFARRDSGGSMSDFAGNTRGWIDDAISA